MVRAKKIKQTNFNIYKTEGVNKTQFQTLSLIWTCVQREISPTGHGSTKLGRRGLGSRSQYISDASASSNGGTRMHAGTTTWRAIATTR